MRTAIIQTAYGTDHVSIIKAARSRGAAGFIVKGADYTDRVVRPTVEAAVCVVEADKRFVRWA